MAMIEINWNKINNRLGRSAKKANGLHDEEAKAKANREGKKRNQLVLALMAEQPELSKNETAFAAEVKRRLVAEGLLNPTVELA